MRSTPPSLQESSAARPAGFDPRILVFACNWCSYAGADTAGVSRLQQSPHFRLLRVMCSGRVHPGHVLRAFARGADGVMVSGCHFGDCHYRFGNYRAVEQFKKTQALAALLGLEPERLRLEWISAAEGVRFAEIMNEFVATVRALGPSPLAPEDAAPPRPEPASAAALSDTRAYACLECGRCTAACPVARYQRFSPRRLVSRAISDGVATLGRDSELWTCLTCHGCYAVCPMGVDYDAFVLGARAASLAGAPERAAVETDALLAEAPRATEAATGAAPHEHPPVVPCSHGGVFEQVSLLAARPHLRQQRLAWLPAEHGIEVLGEGERATREDLFYSGCSPYFAAYFAGTTGAGLAAALRSAIMLLQRAGVEPAVLANERCCGYHLRLAGRAAEANELAALLHEQIIASGCRRVITHCPECYVSLREEALRRGAPYEVVHLSRLLWGRRAELAASATAPLPAGEESYTYQDPCRLGRHSGVYDPPRDLLRECAGAAVEEMAHTHARAICCGNTAWLNCNAATKALQADRLAEAAATGARRLVTACPGCYIHLRCAQEGLAEDERAAAIEIVDLWNVLAGVDPQPVEEELAPQATAATADAGAAAAGPR